MSHTTTKPLHITIFGASRGIGRHALELALQAGHHVTALLRDPNAVAETPRLRVLRGDATNIADVREAVSGADAVVCAVGAPALSRSRVRSEATALIVQAMREQGIERLLCVSVLGAGEQRAALPFLLRRVIFPTYLRRPVAEHERQERLLRDSELDCTAVRPPTLTDGPRTGQYAHGFGVDFAGLTLKVSRADVADFLVAQLDDTRYSRRAVAISYARP